MSASISRFRNAAYKYVMTKEARRLLPDHYQKSCDEFMTRNPVPVHWRPEQGLFKLDPKTSQRVPVQNVPIPVTYPAECNQGLWGGEGLIVGFRKKKPLKPKIPKIWRPFLSKRVLYSEILDKNFEIRVTLRTLDLVDEVYGLDNYILKTHEVDLNSRLGMKLKRDMLLALANKTLYPNDAAMREKMLKKYEQYIIPAEEAEWVGLSLPEALAKARAIDQANNQTRPLKEIFTQELVEKLSENAGEESEDTKPWMAKLNPFGSKSSEKS